MNPWINANVVSIKKWSDNLFSLFLNAPIALFYAGQFTKLALYNMENKKIQRAYSYVNPPNDNHIEIYITRILNGTLSNLLYNLKTGENILIKKYANGFFTLKEIKTCTKLWMFATGTAIGPYCSILQDSKDTERFQHIILIHAVRYYNELNYLPLMKKLQKKYNGRLHIQTIISRENHPNSLRGRIPFLLKTQQIENKVGFNIDCKNSHIMLCGNPEMVKDTCSFLINNKNMRKNLRRMPGHITMENYW